jgi:hypothetical protein
MTITRPMFPPCAESVDSLSTSSAIGQPETQCRISESRKPAEGLSRRFVLAGVASVAALPIAAAVPAPAAPTPEAELIELVARRSAQSPDPILDAIDAHRRAIVAHGEAVGIEFALEERLPDDQRQSNITVWEEKIVETDDPMWLAAVRARWEASNSMDDLAIDLLNTEPATAAGVEALLRYFAEQEEAIFPEEVCNDDGSAEAFGACLVRHSAGALRKLARAN